MRDSQREFGIMGAMLRSRWIVMLFFLCACATRQTGPYALHAPDPIVERYGEDRIVIRWDAAPQHAPSRIYAGISPDSIDRTRSVAQMTGKTLELRLLDPSVRVFFEIEPVGAESRVIGERLLPLEGAHNFRDLGGYATEDGRRVRWGMLYRSDDLADLTRDDLRYVSNLDINLVCDFRGAEERASEPSRLPEENTPDVANLDIADDRFDPNAIETMIRERSLDGVDFGEMLVEGNRAFATRFSPQYGSMFERIGEAENLPTLVHCSGGKDRTGFASAIVLRALGVPEETVFDDYLLTNVYTANEIERQLMLLRMYLFFRTGPEAIRPLLGVRRDYLQAAFDAIDEQYGSVDAYLREGLLRRFHSHRINSRIRIRHRDHRSRQSHPAGKRVESKEAPGPWRPLCARRCPRRE